jgi:hypothetical protein
MSQGTYADVGKLAAGGWEEKQLNTVQSRGRVNDAFDDMNYSELSISSDNEKATKTPAHREDEAASAAAAAAGDDTNIEKKKKIEPVKAVRVFALVRDHGV